MTDHGITPINIKQILTCPQSNNKFKLHNQEINRVRIIGVVTSKESNNTSIQLTVRDNTGEMFMLKYKDDYETGDEIKADHYYEVYGDLRFFQDKRMIIVTGLNLIVNFNAITTHGLDIIDYYLDKSGIKQSNKQNTLNNLNNFNNQNTNNKGIQYNNNNNTNSNYNSSFPIIMNTNTYGGFINVGANNNNPSIVQPTIVNNSCSNIIKQLIKQDKTDAGISKKDITNKLLSQMHNKQEIDRAINNLSDDGLIYTTVDDEHYKLTSDE